MILLAKELLEKAIEKCYNNDKILIDRSMEQASVARIFYYILDFINNDEAYNSFRTLNVDCEYNKFEGALKITPRCTKGTRPDLIIHKRDSQLNNILIAEFKPCKGGNRKHKDSNKPLDIVKLEDFTNLNGAFGYKLGVWVKLNKSKPKYIFFQNGRQITEQNIN